MHCNNGDVINNMFLFVEPTKYYSGIYYEVQSSLENVVSFRFVVYSYWWWLTVNSETKRNKILKSEICEESYALQQWRSNKQHVFVCGANKVLFWHLL